MIGVTDFDGNEYTDFNADLPLYIELGEDWNKDDINAIFFSQGQDEVVSVSKADDLNSPSNGKTVKLILKHFSPYAVYDKLTDEEIASGENNNQSNPKENNNNSEIKTSDESNIIGYGMMLILAIGALYILNKKKLLKK